MAKKARAKKAKPTAATTEGKVNKSAAIREYLGTNSEAKPKEIVAALKERGIDVSPNMVSIVKAKTKVKAAKRQAKAASAGRDEGAAMKASQAGGLDAALTLYKAAQGQDVGSNRIRQAFLTLVELLG